MDKKILTAAIIAAVAAPVTAMADTTVYGQVHMSVGATEFTDDSTPGVAGEYDNFQVRSHASRLGVKGSEDLGNGLMANFMLEYQVNPDAGENAGFAASSNEQLKRRNMWVGLSGDNWGEVRVGRHDTPMKMAQGKFDQFNDTDADIANTVIGEDRVDNVIAYLSPSWSGFSVAGAALAGEATASEEAAGTDDGTGLADAYSLAAMYSNGPLFASLAYNDYGAADSTDNTELETAWRAIATYKIGDAQIGGLYQGSSWESGTGDYTAWGLSGAYGLGNVVLKAQYMSGKDEGISGSPDDEIDQWSLGADYNFSKRTTAYAMYTKATDDNAGAGDADYSFAGVGMIHKF
jgi:predicted porin